MSHSIWRLAVISTAVLMLGAAPALAAATETPLSGSRATTADGPPASSTRPSPDGTDRPERFLPDRLRGRAAVKALGTDLAPVAARNGVTGARLKQLLTEDHTAWLSPEGRLFYQEDAPAQVSGAGSGVTARAALAPAYPTNQTFTLHSRAGAARTIFLDFDGATVVNTWWNTGDKAIANGTHIGWDSDGNPGSVDDTEHGFIQEVWREVAETYAPFDVDVTTQDPGPAAYTRSSSSDATFGTHVVVTSSHTAKAQGCGSCLGMAWVGTFDIVDPNATYQPAWVFADDPNLAPMIVAQTASHEAGHTLGLHHDGTKTASYYAGSSAWGPIMGSSRARAVSQFSLGEYAGANNTEDDLTIIQSNHLPLRADDYGSSESSPEQLGARTSYDLTGVIGTRTDQDVFTIALPCTTDLTVAATGIGAQTTLDLSLVVLDAAGNTVATSSPTSSYGGSPPVSSNMNAQATVPSAAGTYYLRVDGVGTGNPATSGWSDYGSLGQYRLTATGCPASLLPSPTTAPAATPSPPPTKLPSVTRPGAPVIRLASPGAKRGAVTALARWSAPTRIGGAAITKYRVRALRLDKRNRVVRAYGSSYLGPTVRALTMRLPKGRYTLSVTAWNRVGGSAWSRSSRIVRAR